MLEGRNPIALAHYANHPPPGSVPNAMIASFAFRPAGCSQQGSSSSGIDGAAGEPWLRAYVPNINYKFQCSREDLLSQVGGHST